MLGLNLRLRTLLGELGEFGLSTLTTETAKTGGEGGKGVAENAGAWIAPLIRPLRVAPGSKVTLPRDFDPRYKDDVVSKKSAAPLLKRGVATVAEYQRRLAAEAGRGVLVCLQALDAAGKDGTIRHVMSGVNPQGVHVTSFKVPSAEELGHDYLWRYGRKLPSRGEIAIFNRSHYEEVLVVRVHPEVLEREGLRNPSQGKTLWEERYRQINEWERYLRENDIHVVKLFLNLSKEEQRIRFLRRVDLPDHNWKFSANDAKERRYWDDYQLAYSEMLSATSTEWAPWYVVPADRKWFARVCVSAVLAHTLTELDPRYPEVGEDRRRDLLEVRAQLEAEAPAGAAPDPYAAGAERT